MDSRILYLDTLTEPIVRLRIVFVYIIVTMDKKCSKTSFAFAIRRFITCLIVHGLHITLPAVTHITAVYHLFIRPSTSARRTIGRYAACEKQVKMSEIEYFRSLPEFEYSGGEEAKREWIKERCDWCITALNHCLNNDARLIFIFRENVGLPYRQIGEIMELKESNVRQIYNRSIQKITAFMNDTCPLYNPDGACKCRICKPVYSIDMDKEYTMVQRMMRLADLYRKFEKELPRKNYWEKFLQ